MMPCLVIVSRDQPDLLQTLTSIYAHDGEVEIRFDQRHRQHVSGSGEDEDRRSPPSLETDLQDHGFIVIPRN
jgi:hypothetical protein